MTDNPLPLCLIAYPKALLTSNDLVYVWKSTSARTVSLVVSNASCLWPPPYNRQNGCGILLEEENKHARVVLPISLQKSSGDIFTSSNW